MPWVFRFRKACPSLAARGRSQTLTSSIRPLSNFRTHPYQWSACQRMKYLMWCLWNPIRWLIQQSYLRKLQHRPGTYPAGLRQQHGAITVHEISRTGQSSTTASTTISPLDPMLNENSFPEEPQYKDRQTCRSRQGPIAKQCALHQQSHPCNCPLQQCSCCR